MNKDVEMIYQKSLMAVLEKFDIDEKTLFSSNDAECVQARTALVISLNKKGLSDKEIADCTHKMRRCSICKIRNKFDVGHAAWTVRMCLDHLLKPDL